MTAYRAGRIIELTKARRVSDLSLSKALDALQSLRTEEGFNQQTINHYVRAVKAFSRWLWKDRRAREHHLAHLATSNPEVDRRYVRRQLTDEEAARVIQAAENGPKVMGMTGPDRAVLYLVALATGFRPGRELRLLTPERFDLDGDPPTITARAGYCKNKKQAVQPIPAALADRLRPWLDRKAPGKPVFEGMTHKTAEMLRHDLEAAGVPYETSEGVADFYATRVSYISNLVASGASVKTCQTLARHSTPVLTIGVYAKASLHDIKGAVENLPDLTPIVSAPEALSATGTDGRLAPTATESATPAIEETPQPVALPFVACDPSSDLKSSGGEPPCGFESHRRYSTGSDSQRQDPLFSRGSPSSTSKHSILSSRHEATVRDGKGFSRTFDDR